MYKILANDQNEYGPVDAATVRQWIAQGRANAQTRVQPEGRTDWISLSELPEFAEALAAGVRPTAAPLPPAMSSAPAKTSGLAIASLVLGLLGTCTMGLTALIGLILGIIAVLKIDKSGGRLSGKGLAIGGICVSGAMLLFIPIQAAILLPALAKAKAKAQTVNCVNNLKQLALGVRMYANDKDGVYPSSAAWCDAIQSYVGSSKVFQCPSDRSGRRCAYTFNAKLSGLREEDVSPQTVLLFESDGGWNASGGPEQMITHHRVTYTVAFADGSVMQVSQSQLDSLRWDP